MHWSWILQHNCPLIATSLQCCFSVFTTSEPDTTSVGLHQSSMISQQGPGLSNIIQPHQTLHLLDFLVHQCLYPQANLLRLLWPDLRMVVHKELIVPKGLTQGVLTWQNPPWPPCSLVHLNGGLHNEGIQGSSGRLKLLEKWQQPPPPGSRQNGSLVCWMMDDKDCKLSFTSNLLLEISCWSNTLT